MKAVREFFSEITDIDSRLLKTVIGLFRNPQGVVEAGLEDQDTYTRPLRYLLFTSTVFIVWRFIYEHYVQGLYSGQYLGLDDYWYLPGRMAEASYQFINLQDTLFPFQILFFVAPLAIISLKFFFLRKTWREARYITLYSFGQFWIVLAVLVPVMAAYDILLLSVLIVFTLIGFIFRKLLSRKAWVGITKWIALGYLLTLWFYNVSLPATQWGLAQIVLPDRYQASEPTMPLQEITLPITVAVEFINRDPDNRFFNLLEKQEGLLVQCYRPDTTLLWQTLLPGVGETQNAVSVQLPSSERGFLILADGRLPKMSHALLISAEGKILFTKIYKEGVLNGGEMVNETLVLTGGRSNGEGITPFIDLFQLKFEPGKGVFELAEERTYFLPGVGYRFDDVYALSSSPAGLDLVVSKYEITKATEVSAPEVNRFSVMHVQVDSTLRILWETEVFTRTSKYWPSRDHTFQMLYDPAYQRILAFYTLADDFDKTAHLFCIDTLGKVNVQKKIKANELTFLTDVYSAQEGVYFCGWTELGIPSPLLNFGRQGLMGFVSNNGDVTLSTAGKDRQAHSLYFYKIAVDSSLMVWGLRMHNVLVGEAEWKLMKFDRQLF